MNGGMGLAGTPTQWRGRLKDFIGREERSGNSALYLSARPAPARMPTPRARLRPCEKGANRRGSDYVAGRKSELGPRDSRNAQVLICVGEAAIG
jgi:hypothetical protein